MERLHKKFKFSYLINWYAIFILAILLSSCYTEKEERRPNIIFLLSDDQRDNTFGAMGNSFVKTPNVDKLIRQGVRFSNTYIAEPVCSPSRVSLFTGLYERLHGVGFSSSYKLTEEQWAKTYPAILRKNGYYTGFIGKFGVEYYTFRGKVQEKFDFWYGHDGWTKFFPKEHNSEACIPYHDAKNDIITPIIGEGVEKFLDGVPSERSFCLSVSFNVPHGSQTTSMYTGYDQWHKMLIPANENPKLQGHPYYDTLYRNLSFNIPIDLLQSPYRFIPRHILDQDKGRNKTYDYDYEENTRREHHIRYYQTITGMDRVVGDIVRKLEQNGLSSNTIIIFTSDHGLLMGEYGMGGKGLLYDLASKTPFFLYDPRIPDNEKGKTIDQLISSLDIPVTILDYAGVNIPREMTGKSLVPLVNGIGGEWREDLFLESLFTLRDNPFCEGIREGPWKYIRMFKGVTNYKENDVDFSDQTPDFEQLFNIEEDPMEVINLIHKYEGTEVLEKLRIKCARYSNGLNTKRSEYLTKYRCELRN